MRIKTLGLKFSAPYNNESKENAIGWALRNHIRSITDEFKDCDLVVDGKFDIKGPYIKSGKHLYIIIQTKDIEDARTTFISYSDKYGNIFGAVAKNGKYLIIASRLRTCLEQEDAEEDAIKAMDYFLEKNKGD